MHSIDGVYEGGPNRSPKPIRRFRRANFEEPNPRLDAFRQRLTPREIAFTHAFLETGDSCRAAKQAGYNTVKYGSELGQKPKVAEYMHEMIRTVEEKVECSLAYRLHKLKLIIDRSCPDILDEDNKDIYDARAAIAAIAEINKLYGDYAPLKSVTVNLEITQQERELTQQLIKRLEKDY